MAKTLNTSRTLLSLLIGAIGAPQMALAQPVTAPLAQFPAGTAYRQPAPNVIVTLDDSGSMAWYTGGGTAQDERKTTSRMYELKTALREIFTGTENIPDGSIRMAWNTLNNCRSIPSSSGGCAGKNLMRVMDETHRTNFLNWVGAPGAATAVNTRLSASGSTPTHQAFVAAGDYLLKGSATDKESPWAKVPGVTAEPMLTCRRSYNVLMTDGGWSFTFADHGKDVARPTNNADADGTTTVLPDGTVYDPTRASSRIYRGSYATNYNTYFKYPGSTPAPVSTLSDLAFYYWATDLAPGLANELKPQTSKITTVGAQARTVEVEPYWNPRANPAKWQHMTTYTIGFGDAGNWRTTNSFDKFPKWDTVGNDTFGGDIDRLAKGEITWPDPIARSTAIDESQNTGDMASSNSEARKTELWHMALNSRGKFIATTDKNSLVKAFRDIFAQISADTSTPVTGFANASTSVNRDGAAQYVAGYEAEGWRGYVRADALAQGTGTATPFAGWGQTSRTTADKLDALSLTDINNRLVLTWNDAAPTRGALFEWAPLSPALGISAAQKDLLKESTSTAAATVTLGEQRLNYLRGDRTNETTEKVAGLFRQRASRQGDIVNSTLWYVAQPVSGYSLAGYLAFAQTHKSRLPMVYVGGNDGMLHGFSGADGSEKIAYVPKGVIQTLPLLTKADYQHRYYVDGSPFSGDVDLRTNSAPDWRTMLVGTLGAGGKGYFVLDITAPGSTATDNTAVASNFTKANARDLVVMDKTSAAASTDEDADIGHIMVNPVLEDDNSQKTTQIARMNNGRWALVMGNGVNSVNARPVLLIQYLDGAKELLKISAAISGTNGTSNGLSAPRLVDLNGDGSPDLVYAGDLRGNVWKFNVASATPSEWKPSFGTGPSNWLPLYTAVHTVGNVNTPQPITAPPLVRPNQRGAVGLMVAFGTGRNLTEADRTSTTKQTIYAVLDNTRYKLVSGKVVEDTVAATPAPVGAGVADLVEQTVSATSIAGSGASSARTFWTVSQNDVPYTGNAAKKGWYLNLPASGERLLAQMRFYDASNNIELITEVPATGGSVTAEESCVPPPTDQQNFRTFLNINDGKRPSVQIMDLTGDGKYLADDLLVSRMTASSKEGRVTTKSETLVTGSDGRKDDLARFPELPLRPNWRQLQ